METKMTDEHTTNWPDLAIQLYDRLTGRNAQIAYDFSNMHVRIPSSTGPKAEFAEWVLNGSITVRTTDTNKSPN